MTKDNQVIQSNGGTLYLIFIQVTSRALTFAGNQVLLRYLSPSLLGIAVQLELVSVTTLYFARESLRVALQRQPALPNAALSKKAAPHPSASRQSQTVVNLSYLAIALGIADALLFGTSYLRTASSEVVNSSHFAMSFQIYAIATLLELLAEPSFVVLQQHGLFGARAAAETTAAIARCVAACTTAVVLHQRGAPQSVLPFAVGQLAYAFVLNALYLRAARLVSRTLHFRLFPQRLAPTEASNQQNHLNLFNKPILGLASNLYLQSIFKLALTQGDALILSFLASLSDQGAFALASNYGGLLARLVFQPVEESSRNIFGRLLASSSPSSSSSVTTDPITQQAKASTTYPPTTSLRQALHHLSTTLHLYTLLSLPLLSLAPPLLPTLLPHLLSPHWTTPTTLALLKAYIYYIPLLAINGILDAFVTSVASPSELRVQSLWMALFTCLYGSVAWTLLNRLHWGADGLVVANLVNMALRIIWSLGFVTGWVMDHYHGQNAKEGEDARGVVSALWSGCLPSASSLIVAGGVVMILRGSAGISGGQQTTEMATVAKTMDLQQLAYIVGSAVVLGSTMLVTEWDFLLSMLENVVPRRILDRMPAMLTRSSRVEAAKKDN